MKASPHSPGRAGLTMQGAWGGQEVEEPELWTEEAFIGLLKKEQQAG